MKFDIFEKYVPKIPVLSYLTRITVTLLEDLCTIMVISL